jgi:hypothetical protein
VSGELTPERAVRLLRAKAGELENRVLQEQQLHGGLRPVTELAADIALIATLLADFIERYEGGTDEFLAALEERKTKFIEGFQEGRSDDDAQ